MNNQDIHYPTHAHTALAENVDLSRLSTRADTPHHNDRSEPPTALVSRRELAKRLERTLLSNRRLRREASFLYLDLVKHQNFAVNGRRSHVENWLKQVTLLIKYCLRNRDTLARLEGSEFGILLENCPVREAERIAVDIRESMTEFQYKKVRGLFRIDVSIGVVAVDSKMRDAMDVIAFAEAACYVAKNRATRSVHVHGQNKDASAGPIMGRL